MKYIRTKDGQVLDFDKLNELQKAFIMCSIKDIIKQVDTIEELICEGDLVRIYGTIIEVQHIDTDNCTYFYDDEGNCYSTNNIIELYIKQSNGDYKLAAKPNEKKDLELL